MEGKLNYRTGKIVKHTPYVHYDEGWDAFLRGEAFQPEAELDWKDGWKDCSEEVKHQVSPEDIEAI